MTKTTETHQATRSLTEDASQRGAEAATRRAARAAERQAEAAADEIRRAVPPEVLARRFATIAAAVAMAVGAHAEAAGLALADPVMEPGLFDVQDFGGARLTLRQVGGDLVVAMRNRSRGDERPVALDGDDVEADAIAREIFTGWAALAEAFVEEVRA